MATIFKVQFLLTGFQGGGGINTWFVGDVSGGGRPSTGSLNESVNHLHEWYGQVADSLQSDLTVLPPTICQEIDIATGQPVGAEAIVPDVASYSGNDAQPAPHYQMAKVQLLTDRYANGRNVRGGIFLGPTGGNATDTTGAYKDANLTVMRDALTAQLGKVTTAGGSVVVYSRPTNSSAPGGARPGVASLVTQATIWSQPAVLRSRRD